MNVVLSRKREHSRKPDELYEVIEKCSPGPHLELFARHQRSGWVSWGNELQDRLTNLSVERIEAKASEILLFETSQLSA